MIEIKPLQLHQIAEVKQVIITVVQEMWQFSEETIKSYDDMADIDNAIAHYFNNRGIFLVLSDAGKIVGSGAIRRLSDDICELKRMWFLQNYRGRGLGRQMAQMLLDFANKNGYKKVRLDVANEQKQLQALKFYQQLGFYFIERYNNGPCTLFMEKML